MAQSIDLGLVVGKDGVSPQVTVAKTDGNLIVTVTDASGTSAASIKDIGTAADIPTDLEGVSVQQALDGLADRTAAEILTETAGVSVQGALNAKLPSANVVNNLAHTTAGYALDARQGGEIAKAMLLTKLYEVVPSGGFAAQTIALSLGSYDAVRVEFYAFSTVKPFRLLMDVAMNSTALASLILEDGEQGYRTIKVAASGVTFGEGMHRAYNEAGAGTAQSYYMAPYRIWGLKWGA